MSKEKTEAKQGEAKPLDKPIAKKYRCLTRHVIDGRVFEPDDVIMYAGKPSKNMVPVEELPSAIPLVEEVIPGGRLSDQTI